MLHTNNGQPPIAKQVEKITTIHGSPSVDNYQWLRNREDPSVIDYLDAENTYTDTQTDHIKDLRDKLYEEIVERTEQTDLSVPTKLDNYLYYSRTEEGQQYPIYCRKLATMEAVEEIILDANQVALNKSHFRIGAAKISPDHRWLAYSIDCAGTESYTLYIKDLQTGTLLSESIPNTYYSVEWASDSHTLFYTTLNEHKRPYRIYKHHLKSDNSEDALIYQEDDEAFFISLSKTKSNEYILVNTRSATTAEVYYLSAHQPDDAFTLLWPRDLRYDYEVHHHGDHFYIVTNENSPNSKLVRLPISVGVEATPQEIIPHRNSTKLEGIELFAKHMAIYETTEGVKRIRIRDMALESIHEVKFPEPVYTYWRTANPEFDTSMIRFHYTSLITPRSVFDYDMATRKRTLRKQLKILGNFNSNDYQSERIYALSFDGTKIPISIVYRRGLPKDGRNPTLLYGYGAYGVSSETFFGPDRLSLLDRGFIYAVAHVRGGGEMGRSWYENGRRRRKKNSFKDFIACAEHLITEGYTSNRRLAAIGSSAGGLLIGAVVNMRPDLFQAAIAKVPFVDVINTMLDPTLPLTVRETEEWGDPKEKGDYHYMRSYSPYENVAGQEYPNLLVTASLHDHRVNYWEPAKWVAKLRASATGQQRLLLRTYMGAGHRGVSGRYNAVRETAFEYAFLMDVLDLQEPDSGNLEFEERNQP